MNCQRQERVCGTQASCLANFRDVSGIEMAALFSRVGMRGSMDFIFAANLRSTLHGAICSVETLPSAMVSFIRVPRFAT